MKPIKIPAIAERAQLLQTPNEQLVEIVLRQQEVIEQLVEAVERLKHTANSDSQSSSKPPSSDIHKRSERKSDTEGKATADKRKAGGQPGHEGKTRKGFGRVDRYEVVRPEQCVDCGGVRFAAEPVRVRGFVVAELVEPTIEVVEYQQQCCECSSCGAVVWGELPAGVVGEQSLGARLQAMLVWLGDITQDTSAYRSWAERFKVELHHALQQWLPQTGYAAGLLLRSLRDKADQWWYFLDHPEVPPDNNRSERSLRLAVTKRKVCGGSRSMVGFAQTAILLSVIQTCRAQGRSAFEFFQQALLSTADSNAQPMPSLIPVTT
ncbi:MAG: IS66 family transposase [Leptolyngbyaceae cyanobacterium SL_5_9]|nr:IS66 family transposase [Leptolyngbyaceae cyanobacterium SL_5_9]